MKEDALAHYQALYPQLGETAELLKQRLSASLAAQKIGVSVVLSRVKSPDSLRGKLHRPDKTYRRLLDVHDLLGLRVVTYFEDGVEEAANVVEKAFAVDFHHSLDKGKQLDPTQFGYRSLHYVCALPAEAEFEALRKAFSEFRFEIQIRSILQHAWAQMEHDLGYKSQESIPLAFQRRFSRLAGLLEIADQEFVALKSSLRDYSKELASHLESVPIDSVSLSSFVQSDIVEALDRRVANWLGAEITEEVFYPEYLARMLSQVGLNYIGELKDRLLTHGPDELEACLELYFRFSAEQWGLSRKDVMTVERGYSLLFLGHLLVLSEARLEIEKTERLTEFYRVLDYPDDPAAARGVALALLESFRDWGS